MKLSELTRAVEVTARLVENIPTSMDKQREAA